MKIVTALNLCIVATMLLAALPRDIDGASTPNTNRVAQNSSNPTAPVTVGTVGNEPIVTTAPDGTLYISALQHFYRSTDGGVTWTNLAGPIEAQVNLNTDSSISVDPNNRVYFTFDYPYAGTTAVCTSDDKGDTWSCDPTVVPGGTDRMWVVAPSLSAISAPMSVLVGDTNSDGFVNSADISQTKAQSGQTVTSSNFREDVNTDGFLNSANISLVKSKSGTAVP